MQSAAAPIQRDAPIFIPCRAARQRHATHRTRAFHACLRRAVFLRSHQPSRVRRAVRILSRDSSAQRSGALSTYTHTQIIEMASKPSMERRSSSRLARKEAAAPYSKKGGDGGGSGSTGLTSYMAGNSLGFDEDDSASAAPSRTFSLFGGGKKAGKEKAPKVELPPNWKKAKDKVRSAWPGLAVAALWLRCCGCACGCAWLPFAALWL